MGQNTDDNENQERNEILERHLERGWAALEAGRPFDAQKEADEAFALDEECADTFTLTGAIKAALGDEDGALEDYETASDIDPEYVDPILSAAELLLDLGESKDALELCKRALDVAEEESDYIDAILMKAQAHLLEEDSRSAKETLKELPPVALPSPEHHLLAGATHFELGDLPEAERHLLAADARQPDQADILHALGMIAEARSDRKKQTELWQRVRELDAKEPSPSWAPSTDGFEKIARDAIDELPPRMQDLLKEVPIVIADAPSAELVADALDPRTLGLFAGLPLPDQSHLGGDPPHLECITLFQRNLERAAHSAEDLANEVRTTVLHETGHFFGLDEDELAEMGLD